MRQPTQLFRMVIDDALDNDKGQMRSKNDREDAAKMLRSSSHDEEPDEPEEPPPPCRS